MGILSPTVALKRAERLDRFRSAGTVSRLRYRQQGFRRTLRCICRQFCSCSRAYLAGSISQTRPTMAGTHYDVSFALSNNNEGKLPDNTFQASFGLDVLFSEINACGSGYTVETFPGVTATSKSTSLSFTVLNVRGAFFLDAVTVTPSTVSSVPEPSSLLLPAFGIPVVIALRRYLHAR